MSSRRKHLISLHFHAIPNTFTLELTVFIACKGQGLFELVMF